MDNRYFHNIILIFFALKVHQVASIGAEYSQQSKFQRIPSDVTTWSHCELRHSEVLTSSLAETEQCAFGCGGMGDCSAFAVNQTSDTRCVFCLSDLGNQVSTVDFVEFPGWSLASSEQQYFKGEMKSKNVHVL